LLACFISVAAGRNSLSFIQVSNGKKAHMGVTALFQDPAVTRQRFADCAS
jgi:hypothetical protein